jgi:hypothetical protein
VVATGVLRSKHKRLQAVSAPLVVGYTLGLGVGGKRGGDPPPPAQVFFGGFRFLLLLFLSSSIYSIILTLIFAFLDVLEGCKGVTVYGMRHRVGTGRST